MHRIGQNYKKQNRRGLTEAYSTITFKKIGMDNRLCTRERERAGVSEMAKNKTA